MRKDFCDRVISEGEKTSTPSRAATKCPCDQVFHAAIPHEPDHFPHRGRAADATREQPLDLMARALTDGGMMKAAAEAENDEFGTAASCLSRE